jgi:hypothetical protein
MKIFKENDIVSLTKQVDGDVIGERRRVVLSIGTIATIVLVHGDPNKPMGYEIEAHLSEQDCYVLATVDADDICWSKEFSDWNEANI